VWPRGRERERAHGGEQTGTNKPVPPVRERERGGSRRAAGVGGKAEGKWISGLLLLFLLF
jgi:hypothetical protein